MMHLNNKGIALISAFLLIMVLSVIGLAFFSSSINQKLQLDREMIAADIRYQADRGFAYILTELKYHDYNWVTHYANTADAPIVPLVKVSQTPSVHLQPNPSKNFYGCAIDPTDGSYVPLDSSGKAHPEIFSIKVYIDPTLQDPHERIILVRAGGNKGRLFAARFSAKNLYEYFTFTPYNALFSEAVWNAGDGTNNGKMYIGGNITFGKNVTINNLGEMISPGYLQYYRDFEIPPGNCGGIPCEDAYYYKRAPWRDNLNAASPYYLYNPDGHLAGDFEGLLMIEFTLCSSYSNYICPWDGVSAPYLDPYLPANEDVYAIYYTDNGLGEERAVINGIVLENRITGSTWQWDKYWGPSSDYPGDVAATYIDVTHLNSATQSADFPAFLQSAGLEGVIKEASTGGEHIDSLSINEDAYLASAETYGVYITEEDDGQGGTDLVMYVNGLDNRYVFDQNGQLKMGADIIAEKKEFYNTNIADKVETVQLHIDKMDLYDFEPSNGIIWSDKDIVISDASQLPVNGLTVVGKANIYLHGNINTATGGNGWQPAAAIAAERIYLLSGAFNFPTYLPVTLYYPDYPYDTDPDPSIGPAELQQDWENTNGIKMPNQAISTTYNISLAGYFANEPQILEQWNWDTGGARREINGSFVRLEKGDFPWEGYPDEGPTYIDQVKTRDCADSNPLYPEGLCRHIGTLDENGKTISGWSSKMNTTNPSTSNTIYDFETKYATVGEPPGGLIGIEKSMWIEIPNTTENFNYHCQEIAKGEPVGAGG
jgi:hypothetical protein